MYFSREHEWARIAGGTATVGITDYAQSTLGSLVYVEPPEPATKVVAGRACGVVESSKATSEVFAPLSGTVSEVNAAVTQNPSLVNASAEDKGARSLPLCLPLSERAVGSSGAARG